MNNTSRNIEENWMNKTAKMIKTRKTNRTSETTEKKQTGKDKRKRIFTTVFFVRLAA